MLALLGERPLPVVGVELPRPELGVGDPFLGGVAEDLLDLRADIAPLTVLADLAGVDDRGQPLDEATVVLARLGDLIEKLVDLVVRPLFFRRLAVHIPTIGISAAAA